MVTNTTEMNRRNFLRAYRYGLLSPGVLAILVVGAGVTLALVVWLAQLFTVGSPDGLVSLIFALFCAAFFAFFIVTVVWLQPGTAYRRLGPTVNTYTFGAQGFDAHIEQEGQSAATHYGYESVRRVYERRDAFFFALRNGAVLMAAKSGFTEGSAQELRELLEHVLLLRPSAKSKSKAKE